MPLRGLKMLTIEQYNNLSSHINYARTDVDSMMKKEPIANGDFLDLISDVKENLKEIQDIIDFLVVEERAKNK